MDWCIQCCKLSLHLIRKYSVHWYCHFERHSRQCSHWRNSFLDKTVELLFWTELYRNGRWHKAPESTDHWDSNQYWMHFCQSSRLHYHLHQGFLQGLEPNPIMKQPHYNAQMPPMHACSCHNRWIHHDLLHAWSLIICVSVTHRPCFVSVEGNVIPDSSSWV